MGLSQRYVREIIMAAVHTEMALNASDTHQKPSSSQVTGPSGCGKTQLCLMLSVLATMPKSEGGLDSSVIYIDTESAFSAER